MIGVQHGMFDRPVIAGAYRLRPYQLAADAAIDAQLASVRSTLVCHPTAAGKTVLFTEQAKKRGGCLVIAHRDTLIRQAADKLSLALGPDVVIEVEKAQERAHFGTRFIVASVQTLKGQRLKRFAMRFPNIEFIICDEAHRAVAKSYRAIFDTWPKARLLGVTATPDRSDGVGLRAVFDTVAHEYSIIDATVDGWLTPLRFVPVQSDIDLDALKTSTVDGEKDFDQVQLDDAVNKEAGRVARAVLKALDDIGPVSRLIAFMPGVRTAHSCADAVNDIRPGTAGVVDGEMSDEEKRPVLAAHRKGEIRALFNCNVLTEGFDDPTLDAVFDGSPSMSRSRVSQRWGRVTRPWPGIVDGPETPEARRAAIAASPKPWAVVYDLVCNSSKHDVIGPLDLLAGKDLPTKVAAEAKKILREKGGTVADAVKEAREKLRAQNAARRLAAAAKVTMGQPRSIFDRAGVNWLKRSAGMRVRPEDRASSKMLWLLSSRGIPIPKDCTKRMFKRLLGTDTKREAKGLCRLGGVEWLRTFGVDGWSLTSEQALRVKAAIVANGRQRLTAQQLGDAIERTPGEDDE